MAAFNNNRSKRPIRKSLKPSSKSIVHDVFFVCKICFLRLRWFLNGAIDFLLCSTRRSGRTKLSEKLVVMDNDCPSKDDLIDPKSIIRQQPPPKFPVTGHGNLSDMYGLCTINVSESLLLRSSSKQKPSKRSKLESSSAGNASSKAKKLLSIKRIFSVAAKDSTPSMAKGSHPSKAKGRRPTAVDVGPPKKRLLSSVSKEMRRLDDEENEQDDEDELKKHHSVDMDQIRQDLEDKLEGADDSNKNDQLREKIHHKSKAKVCASENCRNRGGTEDEEDELVQLLAQECETESEKDVRPNKCAGIDGVSKEKDYKKSLFMSIYELPVKLRRVRRALAKPAPAKKEAKMNKTSDLRHRFVYKQKIISADAATHLKKFKRLPFKTAVAFERTCHDPYVHDIQDVKLERKKNMEAARARVGLK